MMNGKARKLANQPLMTAKMEAALIQLRAADKDGSPFVFLPDVHKHTIRALVRRDWMFPSKGIDGTRYRITGRGLKALKAYERTPKRIDGLCPNCGTRPRHVYPNGTMYGYCTECEAESKRKTYQMKGGMVRSEGLCAMCKTRPRHIYPSGHVIIYCEECRHARRKEERQRKYANHLERIRNGEIMLCIRCHQKPRFHSDKVVYDYCRECYYEYQSEYNRRRKLERRMPRKGTST